MAVDNRIETKSGLIDTDKPWRPYHDVKATSEAIQKMLAGGTPDWVKHPKDYKAYVQEAFAAEKEISDEMAEQYQESDQEDLTNRVARMVNPMSTRDFVGRLRAAGVKCFTVDNGFPKGTVALWCLPPNQHARARYICYMQVPAMYEWSVAKLDRHHILVGEDFRGWRTVLMQVIEKEILTEALAHKVFGKPSNNKVFSRYHRSLWEHRNTHKYNEAELIDKDV